jgi:hypothetical protein
MAGRKVGKQFDVWRHHQIESVHPGIEIRLMMCCLNTIANPCDLHDKSTNHPNASANFIPQLS